MTKKSDYVISRRGFVGGVVGLVGSIITIVIGLPVIGYIVSPALNGEAMRSGLSWGQRRPFR